MFPTSLPVDGRNKRFAVEFQTQQKTDNLKQQGRAFSAQMKRTTEVVKDILNCQLEMIKSLEEQRSEFRDFSKVDTEYKRRLTYIRKEQLTCYKAFLDTQKSVRQKGQQVPLTPEKKAELTKMFAQEIDQLAKRYVFNVNSHTDLKKLKEKVNQALQTQIDAVKQLKTYQKNLARKIEEERKKGERIIQKTVSSSVSDPIFQLCEGGNVHAVQKYKKKLWWYEKEKRLNQCLPNGSTPLSLACTNNHSLLVPILVKAGANPKQANTYGYQPLHIACKAGSLDCVKELFKYDINVNARGEFQRTPLHIAAFSGHVKIVKCLMQKRGDVNAKTNKEDGYQTPLHLAIMQDRYSVTVQLLGNHALNVCLKNLEGYAPISIALSYGRTDIAALIIAHPTWKKSQDLNDPNHFSNLLKIKPFNNTDLVKAWIENFLVE